MRKKLSAFILLGLMLTSNLIASSAQGYTKQEQANIDTAIAFYRAAIGSLDFEAANQYVGSAYIQHNPGVADGKEGLKAFLNQLRRNGVSIDFEIKKAFADGEHVILHIHSKSNRAAGQGNAIVDIFRFEDGKIVEHWDVIQKIPGEAANGNTMF